MTFDDIPAGTQVFWDANTLIYAIFGHPQFGAACQQLLDRIENQELIGFTSSTALGETAHRAMTLEAIDRYNWPAIGIAGRLRRQPQEVQQLIWPRRGLDEIQAARITELPVLVGQVSRAVDISQRYGLLTNDALIVVVMQQNQLTHLASNDADFDRVPGLTRYAPVEGRASRAYGS